VSIGSDTPWLSCVAVCYFEIGLIRSAHRGEGLPSNELLITGCATGTLVEPIADHGDATRSVSRRVASRCIASDRIAAMRRGISKMATFVHPRLHARGHFCSAPHDFASGGGGGVRARFDPDAHAAQHTERRESAKEINNTTPFIRYTSERQYARK